MAESTPQITENIWILKETGALVSFNRNNQEVTKQAGNGHKEANISYAGGKKSARIRQWGDDNLLPMHREHLVWDSNIVGELIATKRDITIGQGLMCYQERFEGGKCIIEEVDRPTGAKAFFERDENDELEYLIKASKGLMFHANIFTEFVRDMNGGIYSFKAFECRHVRPEKKDSTGRINNWFWSGNWHQKQKKEYEPQAIQNYNPKKIQNKFMLHVKDDLMCDEYLGIPAWWGGRAWIEVANAIPMFHIANLRNGYTIRYHIEIPKDYFWDYTAKSQTETQQKAARVKENEARQAFLQRLNEFLAGYDQAGRAIVTEYEINKAAGKEFPGIKITPINVDIKDKALLELFDKSNEANISGQGIHPVLASIQTQGKLSSGSEMRNALNVYVAIKAPLKRELLLKPINLIHKINRWGDGIKWGFRDIQLTTLDVNPSGAQTTLPV